MTSVQTMRTVIIIVAIAFIHVTAVGLLAAERPNIILVMTDDQGYGDLGLHGNDKIRTPNLDRFAARGLEMTRFYVSPVCAPTRACLMTGRHFYRTGVVHTSRGGAKMHGDEITIAEVLRAAGYRTGLFGKWHIGDTYPMRPQDQGFEEVLIHKSGGIDQGPDKPSSYFDPRLWRNGEPVKTSGYCTDVFFDAALEFMARADDRPFFVYLPTNAPHTPLDVAGEYYKPYLRMGLKESTARVYGMVQNIDDNFGRLLGRLESLGMRDNTLVIFMTDNGPQQVRYNGGLRGRKSQTYEGGIRVPFIVQWPHRIEAGKQIDRIAAHIDLFPTLAALGGAATPPSPPRDGMSLLPLWLGQPAPARLRDRRLFFQCHRGLDPKRYQNCAVVTQRYKMVGYGGAFNDEDLQTSTVNPKLELFDLIADPGERHDLASERPNVLADLRTAYDVWFANVRGSRGFTPGRIHIGSPHENPVRLSRYQDGTYVGGVPIGWSVVVERAGRYSVELLRGDSTEDGELWVQWAGRRQSKALAADESRAVFTLPAGQGRLAAWFVPNGKTRQWVTDNSDRGDVILQREE